MKKFMLSVAVVAAIGFTSCSSDDDKGGGNDDDCQTCELTVGENTVSSEYCDNGDGTITVTSNGAEVTQDLNGITFSQFISAIEQAGGTCN